MVRMDSPRARPSAISSRCARLVAGPDRPARGLGGPQGERQELENGPGKEAKRPTRPLNLASMQFGE